MRKSKFSETQIVTILREADAGTAWLWTYNNERSNMALGGMTPSMKRTLAAELHD